MLKFVRSYWHSVKVQSTVFFNVNSYGKISTKWDCLSSLSFKWACYLIAQFRLTCVRQMSPKKRISGCMHLRVALPTQLNWLLRWNVSPKYFLQTDVSCHAERKVCLLQGAKCRSVWDSLGKDSLSGWHRSIHKSMDKRAELYELAEHRKYGKIVHAKDLPLIWWLDKPFPDTTTYFIIYEVIHLTNL